MAHSFTSAWSKLKLFALAVGLIITLTGGAGAQVVDTTMWGFSPGDRVLAIARESLGPIRVAASGFRCVRPALVPSQSGPVGPGIS
jgi:hypothetical protein